MKGPIPTTAEHINIAGTEEPLNNSVIQLQISEAFHDDVKASVPVVHEITTGTGEYFEYCTVRVLKRASLRFLKRNQVGLKVVLHPLCCHDKAMKRKNRRDAHAETIRPTLQGRVLTLYTSRHRTRCPKAMSKVITHPLLVRPSTATRGLIGVVPKADSGCLQCVILSSPNVQS